MTERKTEKPAILAAPYDLKNDKGGLWAYAESDTEDAPIVVPSAYDAVEGTGGLIEGDAAGSKCKHGVFVCGPKFRDAEEDGSFSKYCTICMGIREMEQAKKPLDNEEKI